MALINPPTHENNNKVLGPTPVQAPTKTKIDASALSDSELFEISHIKAQKNQSNLYLIKSYSFIDKTNQRRPPMMTSSAAAAKKPRDVASPNLEQFIDMETLLLEQTTTTKKSQKKAKKSKAKLKKSKSMESHSCEDLSQLKDLLRRPSTIVEHEIHKTSQAKHKNKSGHPKAPHGKTNRPKSMPAAAGFSVDTAEGEAGGGTAAIKRESFLRQSLQSIRRSFSTHKKYNAAAAANASSCSGSSSASSSSSAGSASVLKSTDFAVVKSDDADIFERDCHAENRDDDDDRNVVVAVAGDSGVVILLNGRDEAQKTTAPVAANVTSAAALDSYALGVLREEQDSEASAALLMSQDAVASSACQRSASSVSTLAYTPEASMAPLQSHAEAHSVTCLTTLGQDSSPTQQQQQQQQKRQLSQQISTSGSNQSGYSSANSSVNECYSNSNTSGHHSKAEAKSLRHSASGSLNQLAPVASLASLRSISPSRKSDRSSNTAKHEQSTGAAAAAAATSSPPEKEKKRKEVSSSRVKKFHRHFAQVSKDEKLINYFSCALVSDILLQGHLYITDQHFAFYSNVFGYVTKVVIPTSSVTKISKEKTAKIIPNAVGVATADERHVFGSFISREAAYRLMCSVCPPLAPAVILLPKAPTDIEISEEYSIEDDSSCSISGNESSPHAKDAAASAAAAAAESSQTLLRRTVAGASLNLGEGKKASTDKLRHSDIPPNAKSTSSTAPISPLHAAIGSRASAPPTTACSTSTPLSLGLGPHTAAILLSTPTTGAAASSASNLTMIIAGTASSTTSASSTPTPSTSSSPTTVAASSPATTKPQSAAQAAADSFKALGRNALLRLRFPSELHVVYLGVLLAVVLALFSVFLLYRILDIENKAGRYRSSSTEFNWRSGNDEDIFTEALRWQKELQTKSTEEAQSILNTNLEQIAKVRRSLETLSMLIHDRSSAYGAATSDDISD